MDRIVRERDMKVMGILDKGQCEQYIRAISKMRLRKPLGGLPGKPLGQIQGSMVYLYANLVICPSTRVLSPAIISLIAA